MLDRLEFGWWAYVLEEGLEHRLVHLKDSWLLGASLVSLLGVMMVCLLAVLVLLSVFFVGSVEGEWVLGATVGSFVGSTVGFFDVGGVGCLVGFKVLM